MTLAIVGARLVDARSESPIDGDCIVVADDGRITAVGRGRGMVPADATILDVAGATVVPGLIDSTSYHRCPRAVGDGPGTDVHRIRRNDAHCRPGVP